MEKIKVWGLFLTLLTVGSGLLFVGPGAAETKPADWKKIDDNGNFEFSLPADMEIVPVQGKDSQVGEYHGKNLKLFYDFGIYSNEMCHSPDADKKSQYKEEKAEIDGKPAKIVTFYEPDREYESELPYAAAACFGGLGPADAPKFLTIYSYAKGEADQETSKQIFQSITFHDANA